jgi:hypothetical protein
MRFRIRHSVAWHRSPRSTLQHYSEELRAQLPAQQSSRVTLPLTPFPGRGRSSNPQVGMAGVMGWSLNRWPGQSKMDISVIAAIETNAAVDDQ